MTKAFFPLLSNNIKIMFGLSKDFKQRRKQILISVAFTLLMLPILVMVCVGLYKIAKVSSPEMISSMLSTVMFSSEIVVLFFGVQSAISLLFFSKDNEFLMALPVTGLDIFLSKFLTIYLLHLGLALLIQLPVVIVVGIAAKIANFGYYILGVLGSILTPFIPLFIIAIIAVPLGYVISYFKRNNIVGTIVVLLLFGGFFAGYYYLIFAMQNIGQGGAVDMAQMQKIMDIMSYIIYPNTYLVGSMLASGLTALKNFAIFFAIIAGLTIISVSISALLYKNSSRRGFEHGDKKSVKHKQNQVEAQTTSLLKRDLKICFGDTTSAINYLLGLVLLPIIMIMISLIYGMQSDTTGILDTIAASIGLIFGCGVNFFAIVAFSREGRQIDILKMLPIDSKKLVNQKILLAHCYTVVIDLILLASMFIAKMHYVSIIMLFVCVLIAGVGINIFTMWFDLENPNFIWTTNKELFKNSSRQLASMALSLPLVIVACASIICFSIKFPNIFGENIELRTFVMWIPTLIVSIVYAAVGYFVVYPKFAKTYDNLEI